MTNGREKRRLLGLLALVAPLPLPFNDALEWGFLLAYVLAVAYFLQRVERGEERWLSDRSLNLLGLAYLPVLLIEVPLGVAAGTVLDPLLHLILFLLVVKLFSLRHEREKWHVLVAVFFVFAGSMATSSHLTIVLFLLAFVALATFALARFAHLYVVAGLGLDRGSKAAILPLGLPVVAGVALMVAVAVPVFALLPRFGDPFIFGQGTLGAQRIAGFSDEVDLSQTSSIRGNRTVVMRLAFDHGQAASDMRFKGGTYDRYENRRWHRRGLDRGGVLRSRRGRFTLATKAQPTVATVDAFLQPLGSRSLVLPLGATAIEGLGLSVLARDGGGAYTLPIVPREPLRFRVELGERPVIAARADRSSLAAALDTSGVSPRMRTLAKEVMGEGPDGPRIDRLEAYLLAAYGYTLEFVGRQDAEPLERFLFEARRGHCELFASSMVLLLRSQGVPARLVAGFLGAEHNELEGYDVVRQDNAHTWVEAYAPARGWRVYDPTPPEGRPSVAPWSFRLAVAQLMDALVFRWDRYVLSFGSADQASLFDRLRKALGDLRQWLGGLWQRDPKVAVAPMSGSQSEPERASAARPPGPERSPWWLLLAPVLGAVAVVFALALRARRSPASARRAYQRLRTRLAQAGVEVSEATAPGAVAHLAVVRAPDAASAVARLVGLYLDESFGGRVLDANERRRVRADSGLIATALKAARRRPSRPSPGAARAA